MTTPGAADGGDRGLEDLLAFIRESRGFDFTGYKRSSLARRISKRMGEAGTAGYEDYRDRLESSAEEFQHLFNTILINVTGFFRDAEAWSCLQREVVPELLADLGPADEIRVWSAGCASGEETYSLAMVFAETLGIDDCVKRVKIYGTDVDEDALRDARGGLYTAKSIEPLSAALKEKYFEANGGQFAFRPDLRRRVIFGRHDITRDAPISRLHLLVCRNTLMYFNVEAQSRIIDRFHFALRERGTLFLGKAEMLRCGGCAPMRYAGRGSSPSASVCRPRGSATSCRSAPPQGSAAGRWRSRRSTASAGRSLAPLPARRSTARRAESCC